MKVAESFCDSALEAIDPYLEGDLGEAQAGRLEAHLASCASCRHELELARKVLEGLRALPELHCPPGVASRVAFLSRSPRRSSSRWAWLASAAALAAAALAASLFLETSPPGPDPRLAQAEHEARIALTVLDSINRKAAVSLRDQVLKEQVAEAPGRALRRMVEERGDSP
ncbi:MAG: zf-HC2 domain-containing protein [Acidobacteria bacterium]|nr:zf-HC2 domain-containing protein [Acidobacteriota bacterium]